MVSDPPSLLGAEPSAATEAPLGCSRRRRHSSLSRQIYRSRRPRRREIRTLGRVHACG